MTIANDNYHPMSVLSDAIITAQFDVEDLIETAAAASGVANDATVQEAASYLRDAVTHLIAAAFMIASGKGTLSSPEVCTAICAAFDLVVELEELLEGGA